MRIKILVYSFLLLALSACEFSKDSTYTAAVPSPTPSIAASSTPQNATSDNSTEDGDSASTVTKQTCTKGNVIPALSTQIDLKFIITREGDGITAYSCYVLNHATGDVLTVDTANSSQGSCDVDYDIGDGYSDYAWWEMDISDDIIFAKYRNTSGDYNDATVVFDDSDCSTATVN